MALKDHFTKGKNHFFFKRLLLAKIGGPTFPKLLSDLVDQYIIHFVQFSQGFKRWKVHHDTVLLDSQAPLRFRIPRVVSTPIISKSSSTSPSLLTSQCDMYVKGLFWKQPFFSCQKILKMLQFSTFYVHTFKSMVEWNTCLFLKYLF